MRFFNSILKLIQKHSLRKVLVAFSGGPDSQALLLALLPFKDRLEIGVAHVDHKWRKESTEEAKMLQNQVEALGLPFYLKSLDPNEFTGNVEQYCRNARYIFFKEICENENYEAVFLGHHRDDLAETILKRVLEGASLSAISGMEESSKLNGVLLLRPMLNISKKELVQTVQSPCVDDQTNLDPRYLRGRFRTKILPGLNADFGKDVDGPLVRLGKECVELTEFMEMRFKDHLNQKGMLDFSSVETKFEIKWLLRTWLKIKGLNPSHAVLDDMAENGCKSFLIEGKTIELDRGRLFIRKDTSMTGKYLLNTPSGTWNGWNIQIKPVLPTDKEILGWQAALNGKMELHLPDGDFSLIPYLDLSAVEKKILQKKWTNEKIPAFFRHFVPVVAKGDCLIREFLLDSKIGALNTGVSTRKVILYLE